MPELGTLGWDDEWSATFVPYARQGLAPGRVAVQHRGAYDVLTADGENRAKITGQLRREAEQGAFPVVGDWVALDPDAAIVAGPRRTKPSRRAAHDEGSDDVREQVIRCQPRRRLHRRLARRARRTPTPAVRHAGARERRTSRALAHEGRSRAGSERCAKRARRNRRRDPDPCGLDRSGLGLDAVREHLAPNLTGALVGPSGVGKSTLVNALAGQDDLLPPARRAWTARDGTRRRAASS